MHAVPMSQVTGVSKTVPAVSGFIDSIHSGDESAKTRALSNIAKTENYILLSIVPANNSSDHTPSLRLQTISSSATILYTLDGSSPIPTNPNVKSAV